MTDGFKKCRYQIAGGCHNWTDEGLTLGGGRAYLGPPGTDGFSTLVEVDQPICRPCLATNPEPMDPGPYYGDPVTNPDAVPISVPRYAPLDNP